MESFRIQSSQTEYFLISNGEETDGSIVATVPKSEFNPNTTVRILVHVLNLLTMVASQLVSINPPIGEGGPAVGVVESRRVRGLYVGFTYVG